MYRFSCLVLLCFFFFNATPPTEIYTLSLHDALPISILRVFTEHVHFLYAMPPGAIILAQAMRSEEHTSELQSRRDLVCRLLLEKKKRGRPVQITALL